MNVEVTLSRVPLETRRGRLVALTEDGEATLMVGGVRHYCWPVLEIHEVACVCPRDPDDEVDPGDPIGTCPVHGWV